MCNQRDWVSQIRIIMVKNRFKFLVQEGLSVYIYMYCTLLRLVLTWKDGVYIYALYIIKVGLDCIVSLRSVHY